MSTELFDFTNDKTSDFDAIPAGKYNAMIEQAEQIDTKSGGIAIKARFKILDGDQKDRSLYHYFNVSSPKDYETPNTLAKSTQIGRGQIKAFCDKAKISPDLKSGGLSSLEGHKIGITVKNSVDETYGKQAQITSFQEYTAPALSNDKIPF